VHTLLRILGLDDLSGPWYGFWSGFGADLGELAIVAVIYHHVNCHEPGCWHLARHQMGGYCRRHRRPG
jgi:hypothetical protein